MLRNGSAFIPYVRLDDFGQAFFVVYDINARLVLSQTRLTGGAGADMAISTEASGCRVFVAYPDTGRPVPRQGVFQILDFSDVCTPPPCPPEISDRLDIVSFPAMPFLFPDLQLQLVLVHNRATDRIVGPMALVVDDLQNAVLLTDAATTCLSSQPLPLVPLHPGPDEVLVPNETAGAFLLFLKIAPGPIAYTPRLLEGVPRR